MTTATSGTIGPQISPAARVNTKMARRRLVSYSSLADLVRDLDSVENAYRGGTLRQLGNRAAGPIFGHLAVSMRGSIEGMDALKGAAPLWLRLVGPLAKKRVLSGPLRPGVNLSTAAEAALWDDALSFEAGLGDLRAQIDRISKPGNEPRAAHPIFGKLTVAEWGTFHLRHSELHMSFLQP